MSANTGIITQGGVVSATSQHKRDFSERIRRLYPGLTKILALVKGSNLDSFGKVAYSGKGMIGKGVAKRLDPEWATYTPIDVMYEATGGSTTTANVADTSFFQTGDKIVNTETDEVAVVNTLTSDTVLTVTAIGTWSCAAGQYIAVLSSSYEEGTSRYNTVTNELTRNQTYLEIFREGVSIADTAKNLPQYTNEGMKERYMTDKMVQALRKVEGSMLFSKPGSTSGTTSVTISGTAYTLYSMEGMVEYANGVYPMSGSFNWETFNTVMYPQMPKTIMPDETVYMLCGRQISATMNQWANDAYMITSDTKEVKFGKVVKKYIMGGALEVEPIVHELFDNGGYKNKVVFFQNSDLEYLHMEGLDINIRENAHLPATMGTTDIIEGVVGLKSWSGGANIKIFTDLLAA
jgi:hypothetical protein